MATRELEFDMKTVTLGVASRKSVTARALAAFEGKAQGSHISFASPELLFQTLTQMRWNIIKSVTAAGPLSIRAIARRVERDVKAVHRDVHALLDCGVLERTEDGAIIFPYDAVHVDFMLKAA
jgi:predicted transcriptional regulator